MVKDSQRIFINGEYLSIQEVCKLLNEQDRLIQLIADAYTEEVSVEEILKNEVKALDSISDTSAEAYNDYCLLSNFCKKHYK